MKVTLFRAHWYWDCISKDSRRRWVGASAALCTFMMTGCAQTVAPQNGCMHEPWHAATVRVKRKSIGAYSVTVMFISGIRSPVELFPEIAGCPKCVLKKSKLSLHDESEFIL